MGGFFLPTLPAPRQFVSDLPVCGLGPMFPVHPTELIWVSSTCSPILIKYVKNSDFGDLLWLKAARRAQTLFRRLMGGWTDRSGIHDRNVFFIPGPECYCRGYPARTDIQSVRHLPDSRNYLGAHAAKLTSTFQAIGQAWHRDLSAFHTNTLAIGNYMGFWCLLPGSTFKTLF